MKETILPIDLDNLGFVKDDVYLRYEMWLYELDNSTVGVQINNETGDWTTVVFNANMTSSVDLNLLSLSQVKNLINALQ